MQQKRVQFLLEKKNYQNKNATCISFESIMSGTKRSYIFSFSVQCHDDSTVFFGKYAEMLPGLEPPYFILVFMTSQSLYLSRACDVY